MRKTFDNILFDEYGRSISLTSDDFIEYLIENLNHLVCERDRLKNQLNAIRLILDPKDQI
jgi:hypothetical protein